MVSLAVVFLYISSFYLSVSVFLQINVFISVFRCIAHYFTITTDDTRACEYCDSVILNTQNILINVKLLCLIMK